MATNSNHPSSSAVFEAIEEKSEKAIFGPGEIKEKDVSVEAQVSEVTDSDNQGSTVQKYPNLATMTEKEQDEYWADGLDPAEIKKVQENIKKSGSKVMPSKGGVVVHVEGVGLGLSDQNLASSPVEHPKGAVEISSDKDKIGASLSIERDT